MISICSQRTVLYFLKSLSCLVVGNCQPLQERLVIVEERLLDQEALGHRLVLRLPDTIDSQEVPEHIDQLRHRRIGV